jgi:hypothetical protein
MEKFSIRNSITAFYVGNMNLYVNSLYKSTIKTCEVWQNAFPESQYYSFGYRSKYGKSKISQVFTKKPA